jgi:hypothetical protein
VFAAVRPDHDEQHRVLGNTLTALSMDFNNVTCQGSSATIGGQIRCIG